MTLPVEGRFFIRDPSIWENMLIIYPPIGICSITDNSYCIPPPSINLVPPAPAPAKLGLTWLNLKMAVALQVFSYSTRSRSSTARSTPTLPPSPRWLRRRMLRATARQVHRTSLCIYRVVLCLGQLQGFFFLFLVTPKFGVVLRIRSN